MIKLENTEVLGWEAAIRGMRNPMNSWNKSDSIFFSTFAEVGHDINGTTYDKDDGDHDYPEWFDWDQLNTNYETEYFQLSPNDRKLMMNLAKAGSVDAKYRRMIVVTVDITAPLYWWKEFDTYKVGTVANSCSTMHKIHSKEFTLEDFSCEHLFGYDDVEELAEEQDMSEEESIDVMPGLQHVVGESMPDYSKDILCYTINMLNRCRTLFLKTKDKHYWWQMIQLLPSSYNQRRTVMLNYEVLAGIYPKRKEHKLDEWRYFCDWIKTLPYSEIITLEETSEQ